MFFEIKNSRITVDCFTCHKPTFELYKIRKANVFYPDYIKNMKAVTEMVRPETNVAHPMATLKQCTGINELYKHGAIIPMWLDFIAQPREAMQNKSAIGDTASLMDFNLLTWHPKVQYPGLLENYIHVKFFGRWNVVEKTGIKFIWMGATYNLNNQNENFMVPPAITFFDTQIQTNLNIFIKNDVNNFSIHAGTPIVQIIPLTEKKVDYKCHLVSEKEYLSKFPIPHEFASTGRSRWTNWFKAKNESARLDAEETKSKCPFGFGK